MILPDIRNKTNLKGVRVLLRSSLNVPLSGGRVMGDFRLSRSLETMRYLHDAGAEVLVVGHLGRNPEDSLRPVYDYLSQYLPFQFAGELESARSLMGPSHLVLLENIRRFPGEKKNDADFASTLASLADLYVNDAFSDAHREHASVVGVPQYLPSYAGVLFQNEIKHLAAALTPQHPALFILGGAKFETKIPLIRKYLNTYDRVFVGGALAHDIFRAKGWNIGRSLSAEGEFDVKDILEHPHLLLPVDVVVEKIDGSRETKASEGVLSDEIILDAGEATVHMLLQHATSSELILWNGPLGNYERGYNQQTEMLAKGIGELPAESVVGGGDTVASIANLNLIDKYTFVSTGGGAMLEYLLHGTLPGIEALKNSPS